MAIKKISANLLGSNAVLAANIAGGAISAADIADNSITAAKISASTSPTLGGLTLKDDFGSGVALTLDRTESSIVDTLFYLGVTSSVSAANDRMWFGTSTTDLTITDDGTVGIGTDNPNAKLEIKGAASTNYLQFNDSSDTENFRIDSNFNWAWGTTTPTQAFDMRDTSGNALFAVDRSNGRVGIGTAAIPHGSVGGAKFAIEGTNASVSEGPHVQYTTATDNYPLFQQLNWSHDNISLNFDSYFDGSWRSSDAGSNFQIYKDVDKFNINFDSGIAAGSVISWNPGFTMKADGLVGIGQSNPATLLHVFGTNPVVRVSDDGTTGYPTLELRQQNTGTEGTELMYDSGTGHTHLNTVYGADLKIATNTGSFGTTSTNVRLTVKSDGEIHVGKSGTSTDRIEFVGNVNISAPSTSNHDLGTRLSFYDTSANAFYAQGIESNHMWFNADDGGSYKFYTRGVQKVHIDCSSPMPKLRVGTDSTNAMRLGSITAVFPYSGPTLIAATPGATLTIHSSTNSTGSWSTLANSTNFPDYLRNTATFNTINTSQQANIIVYLNVATKVYLARDPGWNSVSLTDWVQIADNYVYGSSTSNVYVRYLPAGTHSLDNDSALYFFEAPIGP